MSTYEGEGHGVSEDGHAIGHSPVPHVRQMYISSSSTRSSEAGHSHRLRSPIVPLVRSPGLRLYLSSSFARSVDTRIRNSPTVRASPVNAHTSVDTRIRNSPTVRASPVNAHTSVDTRIRNSPTVQASPVNAHTSVDTRIRNSPTVRASPVNAHTSADIATVRRSSNVITHTPADASGLPSKSRKRKLTSDIWDDFTAIYGDDGRLMQGQCIHCDTIFQTDKKFGTSHCRRHRLVCIEKAKMDELMGSMQPGDARIPVPKRFKFEVVKRFKFDKERACYEPNDIA